ncbi:hypothetical protein [Streptomyces sp. NPDC060205]|uniref:hypothetical protein n=1 Tax=Streptomyces sp. NPDC060205 TaxID=3347072 RepID=UPI0036632710
MNPLDILIKQQVVPVAKAVGFTKKGRVFRLAAANGDHLLMHFDTHKVDPKKYVFDVTFWIVPLPHWEFLRRQEVVPSEPHAGGALATYPVVPPAVVAHEPEDEMPFRSRWAFSEPKTRDICGRELARVLAEEAFPRVIRLLDRRTFLEETRVNPNGELVRLGGATQSEIMLRIDDDPIAELTALLDRAEEDGLSASVVMWARQRLRRRAIQEGGTECVIPGR